MSTQFRPPSLSPPVVPPTPRRSGGRRLLHAVLSVLGVVAFVAVCAAAAVVTYRYTWPDASTAAPVSATSVAPVSATETAAVVTEVPVPSTETPAASTPLDDAVVKAGIEGHTPAEMDELCGLINTAGEPATKAVIKAGFDQKAPELTYLFDRIWVGLVARC